MISPFAQVQPWKKGQKDPLNIFVFYAETADAPERQLLEHWQCVYTQKSNAFLQGSDVKALYVKFVIMFRSLYVYLKVLPAYRLFRTLAGGGDGPRLEYAVSPAPLAAMQPFGAAKPERVEIGRLETPFGTIEVTVAYRRDVSFAQLGRLEVIPAESIIPDYAPSLASKLPSRTSTKPVAIQSGPALPRQSSSDKGSRRGRSNTAAAMGARVSSERTGGSVGHASAALAHQRATEARSQPALIDHSRLSFSPPFVGAQSLWADGLVPPRERQNSEPPFPSFAPHTPVGGFSSSPRFPGGTSFSPRSAVAAASAGSDGVPSIPRSTSFTSPSQDGDRVLTAVSPPSFSMYERALHESPDPEFDGPVFSIEGSFTADEDDVNSFVRFCQSKPFLMLIEDERGPVTGRSDRNLFSVKN